MPNDLIAYLLMTNGHSTGKFPYDDDPNGHASRAIASLDGQRWFSSLLSRNFADPLSGPHFIPSDTDFIQCAGSAEALTVELSELCDDGVVRRWILGRADEQVDDMVKIRWSESGETDVFGHEVWAAEDAAGLFVAYYESGADGVVASRRLGEEVPPFPGSRTGG